jgi:hypothetical protein
LAQVEFAIGARRIAPLWRLLEGVADKDWAEAIDMDGAQVAVASYCPDWWPTATQLLIRRVRLDISAGHISADPSARRRRTLRPYQRALPIAELNAVYGYSFIMTNRDVSTSAKPLPWSTGTGTGPRSKTSSATPSSALRCVTFPRGTRRSTGRGRGVRCSRSTTQAGCTISPLPPQAVSYSVTASATAKP